MVCFANLIKYFDLDIEFVEWNDSEAEWVDDFILFSIK